MGRVQGVFFRDFTRLQANELHLKGYVRNLSGGEAVEVIAEGEKQALEKLLEKLRKGPPRSSVEEVTVEWTAFKGEYVGFDVKY